LAVNLARRAVFGDSVMSTCTPYDARDFQGILTTEQKETIRNLYTGTNHFYAAKSILPQASKFIHFYIAQKSCKSR